jgi:hypothetical protein
MKIEKIERNKEEHYNYGFCTYESPKFNEETEKWEHTGEGHNAIGYKIDSNIICEQCLQRLTEIKKIFESNSKIKSVEL